jgi:hypothetical protein
MNRFKKILGFSKGKAATFLAMASIVGFIASPASANEESWNLEVNVVDTGCTPIITPPTWSPDPIVTYNDVDGNEVDLDTLDWDWSVSFSLSLDITPGQESCENTSIDPSGTVEASFTSTDNLAIDTLTCSGVDICDAYTLYQMMGSQLTGTIDTRGLTAEGTYSGTLNVVWTPAG